MEKKKPGVISELWRKFLVALKRRPQLIALTALILTFLFYALNLMYISDTTAKIQGTGMGLCGFCTMLFSMLSFMCFINAFPYRKKPNVPMIILMFIMFAIIIGADVLYIRQIYAAVYRAENPTIVTVSTIYIAYAEWYLRIHIYMMVITIALILLLPVYSKLIRRIKTSIEVEDNGEMAAIDLTSET